MKINNLYDLLDITNADEVLNEILHVVYLMTDDFEHERFKEIFHDVGRLFNGDFPGYQASKTKYHDLEHTHSVVLATIRLMHGCQLDGAAFTSHHIFLCLISSLFHDVGLIQTEEETKGTGARFTVGHEQRSIDFMKDYLSSKNFPSADAEDCEQCIQSTILSLPVKDIRFRTKEIEMIGHIVGSADLLAQMADRNYLEKLLLLFKEFEEADIPGFDSELDLLQKTEGFYTFVAKKRLDDDLGGISRCMGAHFKARWNMEQDLYEESISKNIEYLKSLVIVCEDSFQCYLDNLKRIVETRK
jgi:hypothetical protein